MSHAMTMTKSGKLICFNSNCSPVRLDGHTPYGWVEYRFSEDNGKTFSDFNRLEYSWQAIMDGKFTVSVEKAVTAYCQQKKVPFGIILFIDIAPGHPRALMEL